MVPARGSRPFSLEPSEIESLRQALSTAGFQEDKVLAALGVRSMSDLADLPADLALERTAGDTPLAVLIQLFVIGVPVAASVAARALAPASVERLASGGMLQRAGSDVLGKVKLAPLDGLVLAFDRSFPGDELEAADHVMGPSNSARRLSRLITSREGGDVLDLGTGCGYLALLAARSAAQVVATDLNERAAAFTEFNAKLNGVTNVEALAGDLFAPVAGRSFDLVISNPPFVISPTSSITYLHGGMESDAFCRRLVREAPSVLRPGGLLQMLFAWVEIEDADWHQGLGGWFEGTGCEAWVLRHATMGREEHARGWMNAGRLHPGTAAEQSARLAEWLRYFEAARIASVGTGLLSMRKGARPWFRAFDAPARVVAPAGPAIEARLGALAALDGLREDDALFQTVFKLSPDAELVLVCAPSADGWAQRGASVRVTQGLAYEEEVDPYVAELLGACDGGRTLRQAVDAAAQKLGLEEEEVPDMTADIVRQLVEEGFLVPAPPSSRANGSDANPS